MLRASLLWSHNFSSKQPDALTVATNATEGKPIKIAKTFLEHHIFDSEDDALSEDALKEIEKIVGPRIRVEEELRQTKDFRQFLRLLEKHQQSGKLAALQPPPQQTNESSSKDAASRFASIFGYNDDDPDISAPLPSKQMQQQSAVKTNTGNALSKRSAFSAPAESGGTDTLDDSAELLSGPPKFDVCDITVDVDGKFIVAALGDNGIAFVDASTGHASIKNHVHPAACVAVDFCRNVEQRFLFATADFDGFVYIWRPANNSARTNSIPTTDSAAASAAASTPIYNRPSQVMQIKNGRLVRKIVWSPVYDAGAGDGVVTMLLAACGGEHLLIWNETSQTAQCEFTASDGDIVDAIWSADARMVLACLVSGHLIWVDCASGALIRTMAVSDQQCPLMSLTLCVMQIAGLDKRPHSVVCTVDFLGNMCAIDVNTGTQGFSRQLGNFLPIDIKWCPLSKLFFATGSTMSVYAFSLDGSYVGRVVDGENSWTLRMCLLPNTHTTNAINGLHQQQNCLAYTTGNGCLKLLSYSADAAYSFTPMSTFGSSNESGAGGGGGGPLFVTRVGYVNIKVAAPTEPCTFGIPLGEAIERVTVSRGGLLAVLTLEHVWVWQIVRPPKPPTETTTESGGGGGRSSSNKILDHVKRLCYSRPDTMPAPGEMGGIVLFGDHFVVVLKSRVDLLNIADGRLDRYWEFEPNVITAVKLCQTGAASAAATALFDDGGDKQSMVGDDDQRKPDSDGQSSKSVQRKRRQHHDGCFLVGLFDGRIYKLFFERNIQLLLVRSTAENGSPPKMLDLSSLHQRLAVLHQNGELFVYDVSCTAAVTTKNAMTVRRAAGTPLLVLKEVGVHSVVWSYDHECLLTYTRSNTIFWNFITFQAAELRPQQKQIITQNSGAATGNPVHVLSFRNGTVYYVITTALRLESVQIDFSDLTRQLVERRLFADAYRLAMIGSSTTAAAASNNQLNAGNNVDEWRRFVQECLLAMQLSMAVKINAKLRDAQTGFLIDFLASSTNSDEHAAELAKALSSRQQPQQQSQQQSPATSTSLVATADTVHARDEAHTQNASHTVVLLAHIHAFQGRFFEAARLFRRANRYDLVYEMYSDLEMYEQALQAAQEMPNAEHLKTELVNKHAQVVLARGEYERAVDLFFNVGDIPRAVQLILDNILPGGGTNNNSAATHRRNPAAAVIVNTNSGDDAAARHEKILSWAKTRLNDALQQIQPLRMYSAKPKDEHNNTASKPPRETYAAVLVRIGQFFEQQQQWSQAVSAFEKAGDMPSIIRVHARKGDWDYLLKLVKTSSSGGDDDDDDGDGEVNMFGKDSTTSDSSITSNTAVGVGGVNRRSIICRNVFVPYAIEMSNRGLFFEAQKALFEARLFDEAEQMFADPLMKLTLERHLYRLASRLHFERTRQLLRRIITLHKSYVQQKQKQQQQPSGGGKTATSFGNKNSRGDSIPSQLVELNRKYAQHRSLAQLYYFYSIVEHFVSSDLYRLGALYVMPSTSATSDNDDGNDSADDTVLWLNELFVTDNKLASSLLSVYHSSRFLLNEIMSKVSARSDTMDTMAQSMPAYDGISYSIVVAGFVGTSYLLRSPVVAAKLFRAMRKRLVLPSWLGDTVQVYASRIDVQLLGMKRHANRHPTSGVIAPFVCPRCHVIVPPLTPDVGNACSNCKTSVQFSVMPVRPLPLIEFRARNFVETNDLHAIVRALQDGTPNGDDSAQNKAAVEDPFAWPSTNIRRNSGPENNGGVLEPNANTAVVNVNSLQQLKAYVPLRRLVVVNQIHPLSARLFFNSSDVEHFSGFRCESLQCKVACCPRCGSFFIPSDIEYVKWHALTSRSQPPPALEQNDTGEQRRKSSLKSADRPLVAKTAANNSTEPSTAGSTVCALCDHRWDLGKSWFLYDAVPPQAENISLDNDGLTSFVRGERRANLAVDDFFSTNDLNVLNSGDGLTTNMKTAAAENED